MEMAIIQCFSQNFAQSVQNYLINCQIGAQFQILLKKKTITINNNRNINNNYNFAQLQKQLEEKFNPCDFQLTLSEKIIQNNFKNDQTEKLNLEDEWTKQFRLNIINNPGIFKWYIDNFEQLNKKEKMNFSNNIEKIQNQYFGLQTVYRLKKQMEQIDQQNNQQIITENYFNDQIFNSQMIQRGKSNQNYQTQNQVQNNQTSYNTQNHKKMFEERYNKISKFDDLSTDSTIEQNQNQFPQSFFGQKNLSPINSFNRNQALHKNQKIDAEENNFQAQRKKTNKSQKIGNQGKLYSKSLQKSPQSQMSEEDTDQNNDEEKKFDDSTEANSKKQINSKQELIVISSDENSNINQEKQMIQNTNLRDQSTQIRSFIKNDQMNNDLILTTKRVHKKNLPFTPSTTPSKIQAGIRHTKKSFAQLEFNQNKIQRHYKNFVNSQN